MKIKYTLLLLIFVFSCKKENKTAKKDTVAEVNKSEWIYLFDGTSTEGWRGYNW